MEFFRILNNFATILAWLIVLAIAYALFPYLAQFWVVIETVHHFAV
jgi:hypothetical protein